MLLGTRHNGAVFSDCKKYRYALWRIWDESKSSVMFIGLNPSTADENNDDPTIRRVKKFAYDWGFGGVFMTNLFGYISANPDELKKCNDPVGENDHWLKSVAHVCGIIVCAWGAFDVFSRDKEVLKSFPMVYCLGVNRNGSPKHPLYLKANTKLIIYK